MASNRRKQFLFLNQSLSSGPQSQREKELQDAARRAHAARNSKSKRHLSLAESVPATSRNRRLDKAARHSIEGLQHGVLPVKPTKKLHLPIRSRTPKIKPEQSSETGSLTSTLPLGQGNHDPFDTASVFRLPPFIYGVLDHCESMPLRCPVNLLLWKLSTLQSRQLQFSPAAH